MMIVKNSVLLFCGLSAMTWTLAGCGKQADDAKRSPPGTSPTASPTTGPAQQIAAGVNFTCAVLTGGSVKCWGLNDRGQLGYDDTVSRGGSAGSMAALVAVNLGTGRTAKQVATGVSHTCVLLDNGSVKCWGSNQDGELGYDDSVDRGGTAGSMAALSTVNLGTGRTATQIAAGLYSTCAILDNGTLKCWGLNWTGNLGYDDTVIRGNKAGDMAALGVVNLGTGRTAIQISVTDFGGTCAVLDNGTVKCWGRNSDGQLGYDDAVARGGTSGSMAALATVNLGTGRTAKQISTSPFHTCAVLDNGTVKCWGSGTYGQLGSDSPSNKGAATGDMAALAAVNLGTGRTATQVATGNNYSCAVLDNGTIKCWGFDMVGQLGFGGVASIGNSAGSMARVPFVDLGAGRTAKQITTGDEHTCVVLDNNTVKCWGRNSEGQLGYDDTVNKGDSTGAVAALAGVLL